MNQILAIFAMLACSLQAANRALLVGVRFYPNYPGLSLDGPRNDVEKLADVLKKDWGFAPANLTLLLDERGTRTNILAELDRLIGSSQSGDHVLFYYSGHGTSFHDLATHGFGMDIRTGAIVPEDLVTGSPQQVLDGLIVGARDLRPRFTRLEQKGVQLIVLFDSCYSGDAAKAVPALVSRDAELFARSGEAVQKEFDKRLDALLNQSPANSVDDWPYSSVVYISAAARHEKAWDIPASVIKTGMRKTIDNLAHGAFTNGLLEGLAGAADLDHDGQITYRELHNFLMQRVQTQNGQTPQLFPRGLDAPLVNEPIFGSRHAPAASSVESATMLRVKLDAIVPELAAALARNRNILLSTRDYDVRVIQKGGALLLEHVSGGRIYPDDLDQATALPILERLAEAQRVVGLRYPAQDFNVTLSVENLAQNGVQLVAETASSFRQGDLLRIRITPDQSAYLIALDVDVTGVLTLLYPLQAADLKAAGRGETVEAATSAVVQPFGTETLKVFAFREKPQGYDGLLKTPQIEGQEAVREFLAVVGGNGPGRAQTLEVTFTQPR